jgi:TP901 family phage tail tape measure protein
MPSADELLIRVRLTGARTAASEAKVVATSIDEIGAAERRAAGASGTLVSRMNKAGGRLTATGHTMSRAFTVPFLAVAGASAKLAMDFQQNMELIHTQAGATQGEVGTMSNFILHHMNNAVQGPNDLAKALFRLEGAGMHGKQAMIALKDASDLAMVGNANVEDTAKTLAQAWFVNIKGGRNMTNVVGELNATVGAGDLRLQQLVDALGTGVVASAKQAGLSFQDVTGALAVFGDETNNVSGWSAQFATALHFLYAPTNKAAAAMESMHLPADQLAKDMSKPNGLVRALGDLRAHLDALPGGRKGVKARQMLADILPGGRGRVLLVLLNQLDRLQGKINQIHQTAGGVATSVPTHDVGITSQGGFGGAVQTSQQLAANRLKAALAQLQRTGVELGTTLLPLLVPVVKQISDGIQKLAGWFNKLSPGMQHTIVKFGAILAIAGPMAIFIGSTIRGIAAIGGAFKALGAISSILTPGGVVVLALTAFVAFVWTFRRQIKKALSGIWFSIKDGLVKELNWVIDQLNKIIKAANKLPFVNIPLIGHVGEPAPKSGAARDPFARGHRDVIPRSQRGYTPGAAPGASVNSPSQRGSARGAPPGASIIPRHGSVASHHGHNYRGRRRVAVSPDGTIVADDGGDVVVHSHLYLDGKELFTSVDRQTRNRRNRGG